MWFKLAGATFTNNLGTMDSISKSYMMDYSGLTGLQASPGSVSYATDSTPDATITFTVKSGYVFKSGSTVTASGGASKTYTASADIAAGSSFTMALTGITGKVTFSGAAELVSGGSSGGGGSEGDDDTTDPTPDGTTTYNDVSYWVRQSISNTGVIETPESAGYTRSNIMAINKFTKAITLKGTSEEMYFAKVTYDADGNFLARSSWDTPTVGVAVTYSDTNPFNVVIATKATTNYDLATMVSIIDVRDA